MGWAKTEIYPIKDGEQPELAQYLYDSGLLFWVNAAVLHHFGLALAVDVEDEEQTVTGLALNVTEDPRGVWFDYESIERARQKLLDAGLVKPAKEEFR
jgi:hypothetical protein